MDLQLTWILNLYQDINEINNDKDVKLLGQNFMNINLKANQIVEKTKRY